jgi:hypothetical protein
VRGGCGLETRIAGGVTISSKVSISSSPAILLNHQEKIKFALLAHLDREKKRDGKMKCSKNKMMRVAVVSLMLLPCASAFVMVHAGAWCEMKNNTIYTYAELNYNFTIKTMI